MPAWKALLSDADIRDVVDYVKSFSPRFETERAEGRRDAAPDVPSSPESIARGTAVFDKLQCAECHGTDGRGTDAIATDFEDDWGQPLARGGPDRAVDVSRRRDRARHLPALPHRHVGHADAVVRRHGDRQARCGTSPTTSRRSRASPCGR